MLHKDGIEVYLKPIGDHYKHWRFQELPPDHHAHGHDDLKCVVHSSTDMIAVIVKIFNEFEMANIPALDVTVTVKGYSDQQSQKWTVSREELQGAGHYVVPSWGNPITFKGYRYVPHQGQRRQIFALCDCLKVTLSATADRSRSESSDEDLRYVFTFQTLPKGPYNKQAKKHNASIPPPVDAKSLWFTLDDAFEADLELNDKRRTDLSARAARTQRPRAQLTGTWLRPKAQVCYCGQDKTARRSKKSTSSSQTSSNKPSKKASTRDEDDSEFVASSCGKCQNLKKAPRGKKLAYRRNRGQWMVVPETAPDEEYSKGASPSPISESREIVAMSTSGVGDKEPVNGSFVGPPTIIAETGTTRLQRTLLELEAAEIESRSRTATYHDSSARVDPDHNLDSSQRDTVDEAPSTEMQIQAQTTSTTFTASTQHENIISVEHDAMPAEAEAQPTERATQKRTSAPTAEQRPAKQQRVDIDLTSDSDEDDDQDALIVVKQENIRATVDEATIEEDRDEIEARLKSIRLRLEENQLKQKEVELELKLKRKRKESAQRMPLKHPLAKVKVEAMGLEGGGE